MNKVFSEIDFGLHVKRHHLLTDFQFQFYKASTLNFIKSFVYIAHELSPESGVRFHVML
jgi:hypothetical protein